MIGSIQIAKKTLAAWNLQAPLLLDGQPAAVTNGGKTFLKVGDGATGWNALKYLTVENTDVVAEGIANLYFTNARVEAHGDTIYYRKTAVDTLLTTAASNAATLYYQKSVVDGMFADAVKTPVPINCSANPNYPVSTKGTSYKVTHAGRIGGASGEVVNIGDLIIASVASVGGTQAAVGSDFGIYESNIDKSSETIFGTARRATTAELTAGTDDVAYVTSAKLRAAADARFLKLSGGALTGALSVAGALTLGANSGALILNGANPYAQFALSAGKGGYIGQGNQVVTGGTVNGFGIGASEDIFFGTGASQDERARFTAGGFFKVSNNGSYIGATGLYHEYNTNRADWTTYIRNTNNSNPYGLALIFNNAAPNNASSEFLYAADTGTVRFKVTSNGGVHNFSSNNSNLSDRRVKKNIKPVGSMWEVYKAIEVRDFDYIDQTHDDPNLGVIANQIFEIAPRFVNTDGWGETPEDGVPLMSVYDTDIMYGMLRVVQECMTRIEQLEK